MFKGSEKEYELLKGEAYTIRKSILQFIGFIISIAGIAVAIAKIYINPEEEKYNSLMILGTIVAGLVATTLLFEIIWYKFKSHNRYIGYIQLLTQEIVCLELTDKIREKMSTDKESHLDDIGIASSPANFSQNLFTWEYVMARLNNADFENSKLKILETIHKLHYKFAISESNKYASIGPSLRNSLGDLYFDNVISPLYAPKKKWYEKMGLNKIYNGFWGLLDLYIPIGHSFFKKRFKSVNRDFLTTGWLFPKKVIQVVFFPIALMLGLFFSVLYSNFSISSESISIPVTFMFLLVLLISVVWIFRYIGGLNSVIFGVHSAEYFGWSFLIFRIQLLNYYNILPVYYSQSFVMYFKLIERLDCYRLLYNTEVQDEANKCSICNSKKKKFYKLALNPIFQSNNAVSRFDVICLDCGKSYEDSLLKAAKISENFKEFNIHIGEIGKQVKGLKVN